jgi:HEAT repeat protein
MLGCGLLLACLLPVGRTLAEQPPARHDLLMYRDPVLPKPSMIVAFPKELKPLWLKALQRPESDIVQVAADTIAMAHQRGMPGLEDTAPLLVELIQRPNQPPGVIRAATHALIELEATQAQDILWQLAQNEELDLARLIEPALARWNYEPAGQVWLARLRDPLTRLSRLRLAIDALATSRNRAAEDDLVRLAMQRETPATIRLAAARAAIAVGGTNLVRQAEALRLRGGHDPLADVLAATLLRNDSDPGAIGILRELTASPDTGVAVIAAEALFEMDPAHLVDLSETMLQHHNVSIRRLAARALVTAPSEPHIRQLAALLDDPNPSLRTWIAKQFVELGRQQPWNDPVIAESASALGSDSWRGIEQAIVVLSRLNHQPVAAQLVSLLDHERPEVYVAAAWGLRELRVPETLEPMLAKAQSRYEEFQAGKEASPVPQGDHVLQVAQLFQAFGVMKFRGAEPLLREFVPKRQELGNDSRAAACWALGYLYEGEAPDELVGMLSSRMKDRDPENPELLEVRTMCAIALGRTNSPSAAEPLRQVGRMRGPDDPLGQACGWGLEQLTGEPCPKPHRRVHNMTSWFLTPILD